MRTHPTGAHGIRRDVLSGCACGHDDAGRRCEREEKPSARLPQQQMSALVLPADVRKIAIVGTGTIGSGWAAVFCARGYTVTAFVRSAASEAKFHAFLQMAWRKVVSRGLASDPDGWQAVSCVSSLAECLAEADYVQESVVEEIDLKQRIMYAAGTRTMAVEFSR